MSVDYLPAKKEAETQLDSAESKWYRCFRGSFGQATEDRLLPDPPQQDPPPAFSTYTPSFFTDENGVTISHDPHLNEGGMYPATPD